MMAVVWMCGMGIAGAQNVRNALRQNSWNCVDAKDSLSDTITMYNQPEFNYDGMDCIYSSWKFYRIGKIEIHDHLICNEPPLISLTMQEETYQFYKRHGQSYIKIYRADKVMYLLQIINIHYDADDHPVSMQLSVEMKQ